MWGVLVLELPLIVALRAAAAQVKSAHVVRVYDHGATDTGTPFIVMELLEGTDLAKRLDREGRIPPLEVVHILGQLSKALEQAHLKGIIHRDIKPDNIFLSSEGGEIFVKLLDFGIAKSEALARKTTSGKSTVVGQALGTPFYMSPKQLRDSKSIDHRAALWSVGVVVYEVLTGELPYQAETLAGLAMAVSDGVYRPPSEVNPALPKEIDAWFARACARAPEDRFGSARELTEALRAVFGLATPTTSGSYPAATSSSPDLHSNLREPSGSHRVVVQGYDDKSELFPFRQTSFSSSSIATPPKRSWWRTGGRLSRSSSWGSRGSRSRRGSSSRPPLLSRRRRRERSLRRPRAPRFRSRRSCP